MAVCYNKNKPAVPKSAIFIALFVKDALLLGSLEAKLYFLKGKQSGESVSSLIWLYYNNAIILNSDEFN